MAGRMRVRTIGTGFNPKRIELHHKVIRADGTEEDLGLVSEYDRPSLAKRLWEDFKIEYRRARDERS